MIADPEGFEPSLPAPKAGRISGLPYGPDNISSIEKLIINLFKIIQ